MSAPFPVSCHLYGARTRVTGRCGPPVVAEVGVQDDRVLRESSAAGPSAMGLPRENTTTGSQSSSTSGMLCSTTRKRDPALVELANDLGEPAEQAAG